MGQEPEAQRGRLTGLGSPEQVWAAILPQGVRTVGQDAGSCCLCLSETT